MMSFAAAALAYIITAGGCMCQVAAAAEEDVTSDQIQGRFASTLPPPGLNLDGTSVATNYLTTFNKKQLFILDKGGPMLLEAPGTEPVGGGGIWWCSNLNFSNFLDSSEPMAFVGRCVFAFIQQAGFESAGIPILSSDIFDGTIGIASAYVDQINAFDVVVHKPDENLIIRFFDDGRAETTFILWETHLPGIAKPNSRSAFRRIEWVTPMEASQILNVNTTDLTPDNFNNVYPQVWEKEQERDKSSITAEAEEQSSASEDSGETDPSGTTRRLSTTAARLASAVLRVFGI